MKKLTAWALLLAMCVAMFAGCSTEKPNNTTANVPETTVGATAEDYLGDAKAYLRAMYLSKVGKVLRDFDLVASVKIDNFVYDIQWTASDAENVAVAEAADNKVTIDINEEYAGVEDLYFTLTATLSAGSQSETVELEFFIPGTPEDNGGPVFVEVPEVGGTYKYALTQGTLGQVLYFTGAMAGNYLATSVDPTQAVDVTIEEVEGGVRFFFMDGETKTYIDINEYQEGKAGVRLTAEPTAIFVWNEECKVYTAEVAGAPRYLGTYNDYNTMSASDVKYIAGENLAKVGVSQFPACFGTAVPAM